MEQLDIQAAMREVTSDDKSMSNIITNVQQNPEAFAKVFGEMNLDPKSAEKLKFAAASNPEITKKVSNMKSADRKEMMESMRKAQAMSNTVVVKGVRITQSDTIKQYSLKSGFPKNTIYDCEPYSIDNGNIVVFATTSSQKKSKLGSLLVGEDVFGEIILVKQGVTNQYDEFTVAECLEYKKKLIAESQAKSK